MKNWKFSAVLGALCFVASFVGCQNAGTLDWQYDPFSTDQWFKQKQDHYDAGNIQYWPQRYVTSYRFYRLGGPIFLYLTGPGPELVLDDIETGAIAAYAEEQGAFVIGLEHRYYGKSRPTSDMSTGNLKFLTIPQTIEDIATFVRSWRGRDEFRHSKWVVFGSSYLGSVATWFADKHPELIDAFVASSAPLELRYEIPEFLQNVGDILNKTDPKCYETVAEGITCLENIISEQGCENYTLEDAKTKFEFCAELDPANGLDITGVFAEVFSTVNAVVMYHDPDPKSFPDTNLDRFCKHVTSEKGNKTAMEKLGEKIKEINKHREVPCAEFRFQTTVDFLNAKEWDSPAAKEGYRQLQFQLCNELGWTVASANISQPFGTYLSSFLHSEICQSLFGLTETEMRLKVLKSNTDLKGKNLNTKCGIFVNGDHDPWHTYGIITAEEAGKCGSHGRDVDEFTNTPSYPPQVRESQLKISKYLDSWLKTGKCCEEDSAESRKVITTYTRPARAPNSKEFFSSFNGLRQPNVHIKPRGNPVEGGKMLASPTSLPYQVSTTDVLSVSPRIPVVGQQDKYDPNMYRDPRNAAFRRYRVVKFLRHRTPFSPGNYERNAPPSMEQFEADFPEHSIRIEGRVERVFKNGTRMNSTESSTATQVPSPIPETEQTLTTSDGQSIPDLRNNRFKYVVKQVFKDTVGVQETNTGGSTEESTDNEKASKEMHLTHAQIQTNIDGSSSPKNPTKRQHSIIGDLETNNFESLSQKWKTRNQDSESRNVEDDNNPKSEPTQSEQNKDTKDAKQIRKRDSSEQDDISGSSESGSSSVSSSEEHSISPKAKGKLSSNLGGRQSNEVSETDEEHKINPTSKSKMGRHEDKARSGDSEEDEDSEYYDDEYYDDDSDFDEDDEDESKLRRQSARSNHSKVLSSTEFSSGEGNRPKKLREKISEKIMSSSEEIAGNQKSKEKVKKDRRNSDSSDSESDSSESSESDSSSSSLSDERYSDERSNYSLEPSGSSPGKVYSKKQLAPITKPVQEEPSTVINVEISGSYPRRRRLRKKVRLTTIESVIDGQEEAVEPTRIPRRKHRRRRPTTERPSDELDTTSSTTETAITEPKTETSITEPKTETVTTESTTTTESTADIMGMEPGDPPTNSYVDWNRQHSYPDWNRRKLPVAVKPIQQTPEIINLESNSNSGPSGNFQIPGPPLNQNDAVYIIIGDIPNEDGKNIVENPSSNAALFNFIQKLVARHSSGIFAQQQNPMSYLPPATQPTTQPTTTTTKPPPPPPPPSSPVNTGDISRYLLVRPVQVSLGKQHIVHAHDLRNDSFIDLMAMEDPRHSQLYPSPAPAPKRESDNRIGDYRFKSPFHRQNFERLLSVDGQVRDSDREDDSDYRRSQSMRRFDEIEDPSWRSIRGVSQFGPVAPPQKSSSGGLLGLTVADTMWVNEGVPFLPRNSRQHFARRNFGQANVN